MLEHLAELLRSAVREPDLVARYGGDEFVILVPDVTPDEAVQLADRLCQQVARLGLCTVSVGVSTHRGEQASANALLDQADGALLTAKQAGRNRVMVADRPIPRAA